MDPVSAILMAASVAGGILGNPGQRKIDPEWLKQHFGPQAVTDESMQMFHQILNSPVGESLMTQAAQQGSQFSNNVNAAAGAAGLGGGGNTSGSSIFATAAGKTAGAGLQGQLKGNIMQSSIDAARQMVAQRMQTYMNQTQQPDTWSKIGEAAGVAGSMLPGKNASPTPDANATTLPPSVSAGGMPQPKALSAAGNFQMGNGSTGMIQPQQPVPSLRFASPQDMSNGGQSPWGSFYRKMGRLATMGRWGSVQPSSSGG